MTILLAIPRHMANGLLQEDMISLVNWICSTMIMELLAYEVSKVEDQDRVFISIVVGLVSTEIPCLLRLPFY
jgi:hypothetical protein